jgi:hypothetical protein
MTPAVSALYLENFTKTYPEIMAKLPSLRLLEQYDPEDLVTKEQPYAYVCDQVHEVKLSVDIEEIRGRGVTDEAWTALMDLRDQIAVGQDIGWFVVINGDPERWAPPLETDEEEDSEEEEDDDEGEEEGEDADRERSQPSAINRSSITSKIDESTSQQVCRRGILNMFRSLTYRRTPKSREALGSGLLDPKGMLHFRI